MNEKSLLEIGYRKYVGEEIDIFFKAQLCEKSAICVLGVPEIFCTSRVPWILPQKELTEKAIKVIERCPSGALKYIKK